MARTMSQVVCPPPPAPERLAFLAPVPEAERAHDPRSGCDRRSCRFYTHKMWGCACDSVKAGKYNPSAMGAITSSGNDWGGETREREGVIDLATRAAMFLQFLGFKQSRRQKESVMPITVFNILPRSNCFY